MLGVAGWPVILTGWPVTVGVVSQPGADAERYRCACFHWGWLGVVTRISAASTGGVLVYVKMAQRNKQQSASKDTTAFRKHTVLISAQAIPSGLTTHRSIT